MTANKQYFIFTGIRKLPHRSGHLPFLVIGIGTCLLGVFRFQKTPRGIEPVLHRLRFPGSFGSLVLAQSGCADTALFGIIGKGRGLNRDLSFFNTRP